MYFIFLHDVVSKNNKFDSILKFNFANSDRIRLQKTEEIKTFQSRKHSISQNHVTPTHLFLSHDIIFHK